MEYKRQAAFFLLQSLFLYPKPRYKRKNQFFIAMRSWVIWRN